MTLQEPQHQSHCTGRRHIQFQGAQRVEPEEREVRRARNQLVTMLVSGLQNVGGFDGKADMLNRYNQYVGEPGFFAKDLARYDAVTPPSVHAQAHSVLARDHRAVVITIPKK